MVGIAWFSGGSGRWSGEGQRCQKVGGEDQEGGDGSQVFEEPAPIFSIALRQRSSARSQTVWKAKASRFRETNTAERLTSPCPKLCSRLYPLFFRTLKLSFSIFQRARPQAASSATVSGPTSRSVMKLLR